jgi:hypothetical protein
LAFAEHLFDLEPLTERDAAADPMTDVLDLARMRDGAPILPVPFPAIEADDAVLYRDECNPVEQLFSAGGGVDTLQPELEAYANLHLVGSPLDRRAEANEVYERLLAWAEANGVLRRVR